MTLTAGILAMGRRQAERLMTDRCQVGTVTRGPIDPDTDDYPTVFEPVYDGPCRYKAGNVQAHDAEVAGQLLVSQLATLSLPIDTSTAVRAGMQVRITSSATDPALPGTVATVKAPFRSADATARRFPVEVTDG
ncbi:DUF6093 family protein [Curtobacterium sp. MCBA15_004]|uniref:DUF6093 family protein n=1 Tax=Curtobacterium sp. MCBA15_004 TaxID=1898733 RepID=UPI0008DE4EE0|nr:DUF6093 family protein [Curtobacterium sp. MCBA15_004]WIA96414.1 DUF6093 family protein [Curtobacterium sp. MCBA15_004]WIA97625.1 DUF6093 family protein [Curtobacterium sp. MCBA15_004]